jgi:putative DNA methylase
MTEKRKLIEVALPLDAINREAAREKSIRAGHPSTLHLWWARRPLAACRAVLFASLVDDPSARPELFPTETDQDKERDRLFDLIERLVLWENSNNRDLLAAVRAEIEQSCGSDVPAVIDPFSGGGSIPLEAQRLGLRVDASDLNPVAVLINKALVELPPKFFDRMPVYPTDGDGHIDIQSWTGVQGLAADVRAYARWMNDEAKSAIGKLYPDVTVPGGRGTQRATVITWLWARTITCPNPACKSTMPLLNSFAVSRKRGREAWLRAEPDMSSQSVSFSVEHGPGCPPDGTVNRRGATCLVCHTTVPLAEVRKAAKSGDLGSQLLCTVAEGQRRRVYLDADEEQRQAADVDLPVDVPDGELARNPRAITTPNYGITRHSQLFTNRQLWAMTTFADLVAVARERVLADGGDVEYADAIATYLTLGIGRLANRCSSQSLWNSGRETVEQVFGRNALPMIWVYAEANPFSTSSGNFLGQIDYLADALERLPAQGGAVVRQLDAAAEIDRRTGMVCTDPPYYDNVPYADLSDFFYVWFRPCLKVIYPDLFSTLLVPKTQELIADPTRFGGNRTDAASFFETGLHEAFKRMLAAQDERFPMTVFYAFKQEEKAAEDGGGHVSTGWETMLQGLLDAGAMITGTWPVRTEQPGGLRELRRAALASSIVLVCRRRPPDAPLATRKDFLSALKGELPDALLRLQHGNIAPTDLAQASIGPGMAIFSRYAKVVEADGRTMRVRSALMLINQVLDEILTAQEGDFDTETRWALAWFEEQGLEAGPFGKAETLSKAKNTAVNALVHAGILEASGNQVRLLARDELSATWDPTTDDRLTVWEVTQHLIETLLSRGEGEAAALLRRVGGLGETARELAYRLYMLCDRKKWASEALAYNALVVAWPEIARLAGATPSGAASSRLFDPDGGVA